MNLRASGSIAPDHPTLAGHFPGQPIVPGVVLLAMVVTAVRGNPLFAAPRHLESVAGVKFAGVVRPGEMLTIQADSDDDRRVRFTIRRDRTTAIASGTLNFA